MGEAKISPWPVFGTVAAGGRSVQGGVYCLVASLQCAVRSLCSVQCTVCNVQCVI